MKVLIIHCAYQYRGGEDAVVEAELRLLRTNGIDADLMLFTNAGSTLSKLLQLPFNYGVYRKVLKRIDTFRPDVVHIHNLHYGASASVIYAVKRRKVPLVMTVHNFRLLCPSATLMHQGSLFLDSVKAGFPWKAIGRGVYRQSRMLTFWMAVSGIVHRKLGTWKQVDALILLTPFARKLFLESSLSLFPERIHIKPNFTSQDEDTVGVKANHFLFVGRLSQEKGIHTLLRAFQNSAHTLLIAGDGELRAEVEKVALLHANIKYIGPVDPAEVPQLMAAASALVFPSIWYEGMPLTILEALASGTPVIGSRLGSVPDLVTHGKNGLLFEAGNPEDLFRQLTDWMAFSAERKQQYRKAALRTYSSKYTPEINFGQLQGIYLRLVQETKPRVSMVQTALALAEDEI